MFLTSRGFTVLKKTNLVKHPKDYDAVLLFLQGAEKYFEVTELSEHELHDIAQICQRLGGMPLAIELASSWLRHLSVAELKEELEESFELLKTTNRDVVERQHSIKSIYEQSLKRLRPREQESLTNLAVFQGGFSRQAAKEVAGVSLPILAALHDKAFVSSAEPGYYKQHPLLWQLIRENLNTKDDLSTLEEKHAQFFMEFLAEQPAMDYSLEVRAICKRISRDLANVRTAWFYGVNESNEDLLALGINRLLNFFRYEGRLAEGEAVFQKAYDALDSQSVLHAKVLRSFGLLQSLRNKDEEAIPKLEQSLEIFKAQGAEKEEAETLFFLSVLYRFSGEPREKVLTTLKACLKLSEKIGDDYFKAFSLSSLTNQTIKESEKREANFRQSIRLLRQINGYFPLSSLLVSLAECLIYFKGDYQEALDLSQEAVSLEKKRGWKSRLAWWQVKQVGIYLALGLLDDADKVAKEALEIAQSLEVGFGDWVIDEAHYYFGRAAELRGEWQKAEDYYQEALELSQKRNDRQNSALCLAALATLALKKGHFVKVKAYCEQLSKSSEKGNDLLLFCRIDLALAQGDHAAAKRHLSQTFHLFREQKRLPALLRLFVSYADWLKAHEENQKALSYLKCAFEHSASHFETRELAKIKGLQFTYQEIDTSDFDTLLKDLEKLGRAKSKGERKGNR